MNSHAKVDVSAAASRIRSVLIADDHPIVLRGVREILASAGDFDVVATAVTGQEVLDACAAHPADIALLELRLGETLAPDLIEDIVARRPGILVVILTAFADAALLESCLARGARGVLLKDASGLDLVAALRSVAEGEIVVDPRLRTMRASRDDRDLYDEGGFDRLSEREHEVLRLLAQGMNTREMAAELGLMTNTVRSYVQNVLEKLQSKNRVMALATARKLRLI